MMSTTVSLQTIKRACMEKKKLLFCWAVLLCCVSLFIFSMHAERITNVWHRLRPAPCDNKETREAIHEICSLYEKKEINGGMCEPLCSQQLIQFVQCLNYKRGKFVAEVHCHDACQKQHTVTAVLKMSQVNASNLLTELQTKGRELLARLQLPPDTFLRDIHGYYITSESLSILTADLLQAEYGYFSNDERDNMAVLWGDYAVYFEGPKTNLVSARSYWSVLSQNEYRISRIFDDWAVFPTIYGHCGPLYIAQHAEGLKSMNVLFPLLSFNRPPWRERVKLAIEILKLVQNMETMEYPLHICDVKSPHFGFSSDNELRFIDADTVFTDDTLLRDLGFPNCSQHEDCAFFDCEGWCQKDKGRCLPMRTNNNLQAVCAKVFRGNILSVTGGLLASPPPAVASKLNSLIDLCADGVTNIEDGVSLKRPDQELLSTLNRYLLESYNADVLGSFVHK